MKDNHLSPHWYRVAKLTPHLHHHVRVHRHDYRGLIWYMLEDTASGRTHRFNPTAYLFIGLLDGKRSVQEICDQIGNKLDEYSPGQPEIIQLIGQLHSADLIKANAPIDAEELFARQTRQEQSKTKQRFMNPVALKFPLWDPNAFLDRHYSKVSWVFSGWVAAIWLIVILYSLIDLSRNWPSIQANFTTNTLMPHNLLLMILLYPPIKLLHELGHAFSAKLENGEVHEMGINFLMFMPVPYVNVSTVTNFRSKHKRILVSAAGILVELFLAALGLQLFLMVEPGIVQSIGFNIFVIGGVSSLFFNGNPLLKYDAYYILADALAIPNLYQRAGQYWSYFFKRYLFGLGGISSPAAAPGETAWFICYSIASRLYRLAVLWLIFVVTSDKFFLAAVTITAWLVSLQILLPLSRAARFIFLDPSLRHKRSRSLLSTFLLLATLVVIVGFVSVPSYTVSEGIAWQSDESLLKAEHDGFAGVLQVNSDQRVDTDTTVIELHDPFLKSSIVIARAKVRELKSRYRAELLGSPYQLGIIKEELNVAKSELKHALNKQNSMAIITHSAGTLIIPAADDLQGRFIRQGELLGYIRGKPLSTVRVVISQDHIAQLREHVEDIKVRFASDIKQEYQATIVRQAPEATHQLPSAVLSTSGGGKHLVLPDHNDNLQVEHRIFVVDLEFDPEQQQIALGTRAYVRIHHGGEPLARQVYRRIRQVFLRQFNV
ncbi:MAG: PqqD family peptide modification chaperone [Gammaproteobacteria bacterium]|nr:PqqD family peptide modification chaperone [Gammaproteobacteria bacterium]